MSTTRQDQPLHDRSRDLATAAAAAVLGALGYAIASALARATEYAERVEEDEYCHAAGGRGAA